MLTRSRLATVLVVVFGVMAGTAVVVGTRPLRAQKEAVPIPGQDVLLPPPAPEPSPRPVEPGPTPAPQPAAVPQADDPEQAANEYVSRTRRDAEATAKALRFEAASLRERLKKVESALSRYEALLSALDPEGLLAKPGSAVRQVPPPQGIVTGVPGSPGALEPIPGPSLRNDEPPLKPSVEPPHPGRTHPQVLSEPKR